MAQLKQMSEGKQTLPAAITNIRDRIRVKKNTTNQPPPKNTTKQQQQKKKHTKKNQKTPNPPIHNLCKVLYLQGSILNSQE